MTHDINNRSSALCYIDGSIITGKTHREIILEYIGEQKDNSIKRIDDLKDGEDHILVFGHIVENEKTIYIERESLELTFDDDYILEIIQNNYPDYKTSIE